MAKKAVRPKTRVFISHITEEKSIAIALKELISSSFPRELEMFVSSDSDSIDPGKKWFEAITSALKQCDIQIVLASPESVNRPWVNFEAGAAYIKGIPVIPLCHSGMTPASLPEPLASLHALSATSTEDLSKALRAIIGTETRTRRKIEFASFVALVRDYETTVRSSSMTNQNSALPFSYLLAQERSFAPIESLPRSEMVLLAVIAADRVGDKYANFSDAVSLKLSELECTLGIHALLKKGLIEDRERYSGLCERFSNSAEKYYAVTHRGWEWLGNHKDTVVSAMQNVFLLSSDTPSEKLEFHTEVEDTTVSLSPPKRSRAKRKPSTEG